MDIPILVWAKGNPGAMTFLMKVVEEQDLQISTTIQKKLEEATSIRGTNLYVLWSDLCLRDLNNVKTLCEKCPTVVLEDACSRQDYSGRELVAKYLYELEM